MPYASWGIRLGGYLIDVLIFIPVLIVFFIVFRHTNVLQAHLMTRHNGTRVRHYSLLSFFAAGIVYVAYSTVLCGGPRGQTVGMMAVGVRAVRDGSHEVLGYGKAFGRALAEQVLRLLGLLLVFGLLWLLDMLWPLWDKKRQTLHDKVSGTVVLRTRNTG
jgi:uncharacterized RDD family membrane protein YckC